MVILLHLRRVDARLGPNLGTWQQKGIVWITWTGPHADYDDVDVRTVEYGD